MGHKCSRYASLSPNTMCSEVLYQMKKEAKSFFFIQHVITRTLFQMDFCGIWRVR